MNIEIEKIRIDGGTQARAAINYTVVDEYAAIIREGDDFDPVVVYHDGAEYWLADGFHRYHAYRKAMAIEMPAEIRQGSLRDAVLFSLGSNATHGLRRTNADKEKAVMTMLKDGEWAAWSDREIARRCVVNNHFVARIRAEIKPETEKRAIDSKGKKSNNGSTPIVLDDGGDEEKRKFTTSTGKTSTRTVKPKPPTVNTAGMEILTAKKEKAKDEEAAMLEAHGIEEGPIPEHSAPEEDDGKTVPKWRYEKLKQDYHREKSRADMWEKEAAKLQSALDKAKTDNDLLDSENQNLVERTAEYEELKAIVDADDSAGKAAEIIKEQEKTVRRLESRIESMQYDGAVLARELEWRRKKMKKDEKLNAQEG